jgi:allophanate hydrolase
LLQSNNGLAYGMILVRKRRAGYFSDRRKRMGIASDESESLGITVLSEAYARGLLDPAQVIERVLARNEEYPDRAVWIERCSPDEVRAQLSVSTRRKRDGIPQPLWGIPFAIKDNIDLAGHRTTSACPAFAYEAAKSSTVVKRLCDAGAIALGKTNMDQFATGLVGTRSPYGVCRNAFNSAYISGGSSSGSAVAVAAGLASFALGTDTAGSGRVPAAFNNIVGLKPSRGLLSSLGLVPACRSLDCVSIFALSCQDAQLALAVAEGYDAEDPYSRKLEDIRPRHRVPTQRFHFGIPRAAQLQFFGDHQAAALYGEAVKRLVNIGGIAREIDFQPFLDTAKLLYAGPWVAERYLATKDLVDHHPEAMLAVTRSIISRGASILASEAFAAMYELERCRKAAEIQWDQMDLMLLPTTGSIYRIDQVLDDPVGLNTNLGYYTNFVNLLDLCAVAVPAGFRSDGLPFGVSLVAPAGNDPELLELGARMHSATGEGSGVGRYPLPDPPASPKAQLPGTARLAVVGAHLDGLPLNHQLTDRGGQLIETVMSADCYRLFALPGTVPPKPGMVRVADGSGVPQELEIWELSLEAFGDFVAMIPSPLGIGSVQLADGRWVQGFICESIAVAGARDISEFGGWRAFLRNR